MMTCLFENIGFDATDLIAEQGVIRLIDTRIIRHILKIFFGTIHPGLCPIPLVHITIRNHSGNGELRTFNLPIMLCNRVVYRRFLKLINQLHHMLHVLFTLG